ncbi:MAG: drug resistance transporter [Alphaproteobacteria bacterium]|jgi:DHA1 family bicyclomycin/chloramphenicol resistance-like MFS transporter|nr:drug resistance transporter [Alphaproteobacteria bacterium]
MPRYFLPLLILSLIACCIEVDISVPSFPDMGRYFNVEDGIIQMTVAYNFLGFCLGAAIYGPLSDAYGRRPVMVWGNAILALGAVGCVMAPSIPFLLGTRFIQGIGASTSAVVMFAMIADAYPQKDKAASLIGMMNAVFSSLMAMAPIVGGFMNEAVGWRGNYAIVALICLLSSISLALFLPETKKTFDPFYLPKIRRDYRKLLTSFSFISASLAPSLSYAGYLAFVAQAPFLYTETFHLSLTQYVLHQSVIILCFAVVSLFSGRIIKILGARGCVIKGILLSGVSTTSLVVISLVSPTSPYLTTLFMGVGCIGAALFYPIIFAASIEIFPEIKGTSSSLVMSMRSFVCFACVGVAGHIYNGHPLRIALVILSASLLSAFFILSLLRSGQFTPKFSLQGAS